jgi:hypothetical protein
MRLRFIIQFFSLFIFSFTATAQDSLYARNVIKILTSPEFHGRGYAFKGDSITADFISREFSRFQLKKWATDYYQFYNISINVFEGSTKVDFGKNYTSSAPSDALQIVPNAASVKGKFKIIPYKMLLNNIQPSKVKNKFVVMDEADKDVVMSIFYEPKGYICLRKNLSAYSPKIGQFQSNETNISLSKDSVSGTLKKIFIDLDSRFIENYQTQNVCGYIEGKLYPDTFFVIGAHYEHLGQIGKDYIFHGANDNAAGVAMMLDLARYFSIPENKPNYSIAFLAFSSEEIGLLGASYFVENSPIPMKNIKMMLNLDVMGTGEKGFTFVGGEVFADEFNLFAEINTEKKHINNLVPREMTANSDHYPFYAKGGKAMFIFGMGKSGKYHHPSDTLENLSLGGYTNLFKLIVDYIQKHNTQ